MSTKAVYRRLGNSGLRVSIPILGCMSFGDPTWGKWVKGEEEAFALLKTAYDAGVTTWDTANMYSNGMSERLIGKFMQQFNIPRSNVTIATKVRFLVDHDDPTTITSFFRPELKDQRDYVNHSGLSRAAIFNQVADCLSRLKTDYIDILLIHASDDETPLEETMCALNDLVRSGKVRYLGASNTRAWRFIEMNNVAHARGWSTFACVQMEHSLLYRAEELELFAYCQYKGIGITSYSPLLDGNLARPLGTKTERTAVFPKELKASDIKIIERVIELAEKHSWKMSQVALTWSLTKISSPIVGANTPERLLEAVEIGTKSLPDEDIKYLEEL
ncbi:Aldo/keto reductase [Hymenopellis radicata]|nr:Aldo/keto reductase [Hymenopellis radicata]